MADTPGDALHLRRFRPEDAAWLIERHDTLYRRDEGFDASFGELVAKIINDFLAEHDATREAGWVAEENGQRLGSIFCVSAEKTTAKLRLFLLDPGARGKGLGKHMLRHCMAFARAAGYRDMVLWTHESHRAACALYAATGWQLIESRPVHSFGVDLVEQNWTITL
ncbi:GNAT family N-acetyltransferase [Arenibacterium halophilum]|uniref:GNAT family N-acetyltransferase n=1 Tax=Arenibacterium halophilum TaxID=2583821 RepID=A0ABY2XA23_9RHOB|nr:GNAT family N-acetyltransferase [Arenibacterium halophilum]TMV13228.1 GNAT family N-acetyltransferase [Arenibacterium halophilum]